MIVVAVLAIACAAPPAMEPVGIAPDGKHFVLATSEQQFVPWGLNYGCTDKLIEEYWESDWPKVEADFADMKRLGATVVRVHLQLAAFMDGPDKPNERSLRQLGRLLDLAERTGLYLDLTGLACYRTAAVPRWYDALSEADRWAVQARFWEAVAGRCAGSPAVFCYDLMNEPMAPGGKRKPGEWYSGKPLGGFDFIQWIALDQADRPRDEVARQWVHTLTEAIRKRDRRHLVTVGLLPWLPKWGHLSGFEPKTVGPELDFVSVHVYPKAGKVEEAVTMLDRFAVGKPVVIEETFPLSCPPSDLRAFLLRSRSVACGWMGHYAGETPERYAEREREKKLTAAQGLWRDWLTMFRDLKAEMTGPTEK